MSDTSTSIGDKFKSVGSVLSSAGATLTKKVSVPLVAAGTVLGNFAMNTETSISKVNSILQLGGNEFSKYQKTLKSGANELGLAYSDYADAAYQAISAGVKQADVTNFLTQSNKLAKGGLTDLTTATDLLTTVQNAYGLSQKDMAHVSDVLIQTQNKGKTTVNELGASMGKIIPTAKNLGVSVEQLGAGYAIMTSKGIATAESTTYMNSMFNELGKSGSNVDKILRQQTGKSFAELSKEGKSTGDILQILSEYAGASGKSLSDLFSSSEAGKAALTLMSDGAKGFNEQLEGMQNSSGMCEKAFESMDTTGSKVEKSLNRLKNAASTLGDALLPVIATVAEAVSQFALWLSKMLEAHPVIGQIVTVIGLVAAAIGPVLSVIGFLISGLGTVINIVTTVIGAITGLVAAFGWIPLAIAAVVAAGIYLITHWEQVKEVVLDVWNAVTEIIGDAVDEIVDYFSGLSEKIGTWLSDICEKAKKWASDMLNTAMETGSKFVENVSNFIKNLPSKVEKFLSDTINKVTKWASDMANKAKETGTKFVNNVVNTIRNLPGKVWSFLSQTISKIGKFASDMASKAKKAAKDFKDNIVEGVKSIPGKMLSIGRDIVQGLIDGIGEKIEALKRKAAEIANAVKDKVTGLLKINSPSRVFRDEVGKWIPLGIAEGIENNSSALYRTLSDMASNLTDAFSVNDLIEDFNKQSGISINTSNSSQGGSASIGIDYNKMTQSFITAIKNMDINFDLDGKSVASGIVGYSDKLNGERLVLTERGLAL